MHVHGVKQSVLSVNIRLRLLASEQLVRKMNQSILAKTCFSVLQVVWQHPQVAYFVWQHQSSLPTAGHVLSARAHKWFGKDCQYCRFRIPYFLKISTHLEIPPPSISHHAVKGQQLYVCEHTHYTWMGLLLKLCTNVYVDLYRCCSRNLAALELLLHQTSSWNKILPRWDFYQMW